METLIVILIVGLFIHTRIKRNLSRPRVRVIVRKRGW